MADISKITLPNGSEYDVKDSLARELLSYIDYVTPEMYGALCDGVHDDGPALKQALESQKKVMLLQDIYVFSPVKIVRKDCYLDGNGYVVHVDMNNVMVNDEGRNDADAIVFFNEPVDDSSLPLRRVYDSQQLTVESIHGIDNVREGDPAYTSNYKIGFMSYKGNVPMCGKYLDMMDDERIVVTYFEEHSVILQNIKFRFNRCRGRYGVYVCRYAHSRIRNVEVISEDEEGSVGLECSECYDMIIENVFSQGWYANYTWMNSGDAIYARGNTGYGIQVAGGDKISVLNCSAWNCKCGLMVGGNRVIWTTNCIVDGFKAGDDIVEGQNIRTNLDGTLTTSKWSTGVSCHADALNFIFTNGIIDMARNYTTSIRPFSISCPEPIINKVTVNAPKGYINIGGELNDTLWLSDVVAPNCDLTIGNSPKGSYQGETVFIKDIYVSNSHFRSVMNGAVTTTIHMTNCEIETRVIDINHLIMENCTIYGRWETEYPSLSPLVVSEDAILTGCKIYMNRSWAISRKHVVIKAPEDGVYMVNCHVLAPSWISVFKKGESQAHVQNLLVDNLHGVIFGDAEFGLFDYSELN